MTKSKLRGLLVAASMAIIFVNGVVLAVASSLPRPAYKSISIDEKLDVFTGDVNYSCAGNMDEFAYCQPSANNPLFRTYAGVTLKRSHVEFWEGRVSKFQLVIGDCGYWNYVGGESYDQDCLTQVINALQTKYGEPRKRVIEERSIHKGGYLDRMLFTWDLGAAEITVETLKETGQTVLYYKGHEMKGMGNIDRANIVEIRSKSRAGEVDARIRAAQEDEENRIEAIEQEQEREQQAILAAERDDL